MSRDKIILIWTAKIQFADFIPADDEIEKHLHLLWIKSEKICKSFSVFFNENYKTCPGYFVSFRAHNNPKFSLVARSIGTRVPRANVSPARTSKRYGAGKQIGTCPHLTLHDA